MLNRLTAASAVTSTTTLAAAIGLLLASAAAVAQTESTEAGDTSGGLGLQEVTVTTERYKATVQSTPVAVTAFNPDILADRKVTSVQDVSAQIPGTVITPSTGSSNSARIVMRGVGQEQGGINFDPAVGIYIDGVYQPRINGSFFDFFDLASLEVLRGPQGTLYGRNTSGGAIKIDTRRPELNEFTGSAEVGFGDWSANEVKGFLTGPIIPGKLAFSVSGVERYHNGFFNDPYYDHRIGNLKRWGERAKLLFTPWDNFEATLSVYAMQDYSDPGVGVPLQVGVGVVDPYANNSFNRDLTRTEIFGPIGQSLTNNGASLNMTYEPMENLAINSITGYGLLSIHSTGSILWLTAAAQKTGNGALNLGAGGDGRTRDEFYSQEFNATYTSEKIKAVGGLYVFHEEGRAQTIIGNPQNIQQRLTDAYAVFAQATYNIGWGVGLTGGIRETKEFADFTQYYYTLINHPQALKDQFKGTSPKIGVDWQMTPDILSYASWTKGFKSGGINPVPPTANTGVPGQAGAPQAYGPETSNSFEIGNKLQTPNHQFRLNTALFIAKYDGLQLPVFFPGTSTSYTSNASKATVKGIELEPTWQVMDGLQLYGNASFYTGKYTQPFICTSQHGVFQQCENRKLKGLIPGSETLGVDYSPPIPIPGKVHLLGQARHTGFYYNNVANEGPLVQTQAVTLYDASIAYNDPTGHYRVSLDGKNITNKHYVAAGLQLASPLIPSVTGYINDPRTIMVRLQADF
ncbi:MAG: TonB-dependent receptor [Proteobacteria bacterium]|nr:TonB-dependent receptor [Pseudomonadota bacterium]